ncbi:hypothetical protein C0Q70_15690 [Pomacea canaliculata]|uniref:DUF7789 domain-containing protein n=1 Tax=Pomacea canaliculata TaxID=400727 RepID=A0A2T7NVJ7_POMCA|nr:hypothetical protein C0Q70_15690 [Pomacea canaliculata]
MENPSHGLTEEDLNTSSDYSKYGITDVPKYTVTTALGKVAETDLESPDFTFTILLLINAGFCAFYVVHGILRERVYEIYAFVAAILVVLMYCILEYSLFNPAGRSTVKLVRLIVACILAPPNILIAIIVSKQFGYLEFRIVGASKLLQTLYRQAALFSCLLKFDLQTSTSIVVLALKEGTSFSMLETVSLSVGLPFSFGWCLLGWVMLRKELKWGAILFFVLGFVKPCYYIYKVVKIYTDLRDGIDVSSTIIYSLLAATALALLVWLMIMVELYIVYSNFGKGLKEQTVSLVSSAEHILIDGDSVDFGQITDLQTFVL